MAEAIKYDNEPEMKKLLDDIFKFLESETKRICLKFNYDDPNYLNMVMTDLSFCIVMNILQVTYKTKEDIKMRIYEEMAKKGLPIDKDPAPRSPVPAM